MSSNINTLISSIQAKTEQIAQTEQHELTTYQQNLQSISKNALATFTADLDHAQANAQKQAHERLQQALATTDHAIMQRQQQANKIANLPNYAILGGIFLILLIILLQILLVTKTQSWLGFLAILLSLAIIFIGAFLYIRYKQSQDQED